MCLAVAFSLRGADSTIRLSLPYSRRKTLAVRKTPCSRAACAAEAHNPSGIGKRALCPFRHRSKRRQTLFMPAGTSLSLPSALVVNVSPPRPAGRKTDVTNYNRAPSCRLAESSRRIAQAVRASRVLIHTMVAADFFEQPPFHVLVDVRPDDRQRSGV